MKLEFRKDKRTMLEREIDRVIAELNLLDPTSDRYQELEKSLDKLVSAQSKLSSEKGREKLNPNTVLSVGGEMLVTLLILNYEKIGVISSKAFSRIWRGRV